MPAHAEEEPQRRVNESSKPLERMRNDSHIGTGHTKKQKGGAKPAISDIFSMTQIDNVEKNLAVTHLGNTNGSGMDCQLDIESQQLCTWSYGMVSASAQAGKDQAGR